MRRGLAAPSLLAAIAMLLCLAAPASARPGGAQIWLSPHGSDIAGDGSEAHPYRTLQRAQREVRRILGRGPAPAITVRLRGGIYRLSRPLRLTARDSGRPVHPVTYRAAGARAPLISGARRIRGWRRWRREPEIWRARVPTGAASRDLYVNGRRAQRARTDAYPAGFRPAWNGGGAGSGIEFLPTLAPAGLNPPGWGDPTDWRDPEDAEAVLMTQWKQMRVPLDSVAAPRGDDPGLITMQQPAWKNANLFRDPKTGEPGIWSFWQVSWFENALAFLDEPGEWYLDEDDDWLYYYPHPGKRPSRERFELPRLQRLIVGRGTASQPIHDISFRGLRFAHTTWLAPSSADGYVDDQAGFHIIGPGHEPNTIGHDPDLVATPAAVAFEYGRRLRFHSNRFTEMGAVGLALGTGSQDDVVRANTFTATGSSGLLLGGISSRDHHPRKRAQLTRDNTIAANLIDDVAAVYMDAPGIFAGFGTRTRITGNTIRNVPWSGIAVGWGWGLLDPPGFPGVPGATQYQWGRWTTPTPNRGSVIADNTISSFLEELWDGGAIYTTGFQGTSAANGLVIRGNTLHGKRPQAGGNTIYTDGGSRWITVSGNTSYDNPIGVTDFGPPPRSGDPLPYPSEPSAADGAPYGSEIGGCVTYGDIAYRRNSWFEAPLLDRIPLYNDLYELISGGALRPYSAAGFFDICPYSQAGTDYPTRLTFADNVVYPAQP